MATAALPAGCVLVGGAHVAIVHMASSDAGQSVVSAFHPPGETFCARWNHNCASASVPAFIFLRLCVSARNSCVHRGGIGIFTHFMKLNTLHSCVFPDHAIASAGSVGSVILSNNEGHELLSLVLPPVEVFVQYSL